MNTVPLIRVLQVAAFGFATIFQSFAQERVSLDPPGVESILVEPIKELKSKENAIVRVKFARDQRLVNAIKLSNKRGIKGNALTIELENGPTILNDEGKNGDEKAADGLFSATVRFDFKEFSVHQNRLAKFAAKGENINVFEGREIVGKQKLSFFDAKEIRAGVRINNRTTYRSGGEH